MQNIISKAFILITFVLSITTTFAQNIIGGG